MSGADLENRFTPVEGYPVELWNPKLCGEIDIVIRADGSWWHEGARIERQSLIFLFAKLLRYDDDGYYLITPVEKLKITVEDLPFLAVDFDREGETLVFSTDQSERVTLGAEHPLAFDGDDLWPRIRVRHNLWARVTRAAWYRLIDIADVQRDRIIFGSQSFDLKPSVI
ncbi:DUF1285 domain-containing protein [Asticcacaulis sp. SL142]|uniref:DUF1285 domain-containing protein n=1 Tax=Asticcacaulis sp. SL142 TaxID=2995155 RepID=UPI00226D3FB9|nr:DUF1285 domain-containing protein [Asticcacaulis sp. SL142]WAC49109.1 DUF1285 domain-containing protein [Asticcacaulis sp. SL142]